MRWPTEGDIIRFLSRLLPWLAPLPSAALITIANVELLGWHWSIALAGGATLEFTTIVVTDLALLLWNYNQEKHTDEPPAQFTLAAGLVAFSALVSLALVVVLEMFPALAVYAPGAYVLLSVVSALNLALRAQHERILAANQVSRAAQEERKAQEKLERAQARAQAKAEKEQAAQPAQIEAQPAPVKAQPTYETYRIMQRQRNGQGMASAKDAMTLLGANSLRTVQLWQQKYRKELEKEGME